MTRRRVEVGGGDAFAGVPHRPPCAAAPPAHRAPRICPKGAVHVGGVGAAGAILWVSWDKPVGTDGAACLWGRSKLKKTYATPRGQAKPLRKFSGTLTQTLTQTQTLTLTLTLYPTGQTPRTEEVRHERPLPSDRASRGCLPF